MRMIIVLFFISALVLSAQVVHISQLPAERQSSVVPDMEGWVLLHEQDGHYFENEPADRELPAVAPGWPVSYGSSNCKNGAIYVNMDADPEDEILFGVGTKITALNLDGSLVPGWPKQLNFYIWSSPAAGDIDGDGEIEIVCTSRNNTNANSGELYAFRLDGTPCPGFPVVQAGGGTNNVCLYDLDGDGAMEILVNVRNHPQGWVYVYNGDGSLFPGFPQSLDYIPGAGISAGDVTGDGVPEIVALSYHKLHVFDLSGNLLPGFPLENPGYTYSYSQPIIYDLDGDGLNDIIWGGCAASAGAVFAVRHDATSLPGWPQSTNYWIFGTVSLGDVDQDGAIDVVIGDQVSSGTPVNHIFAWDAGGNALPGFPAGPTNAIYAQFGIADLDGDGQVELMIDDNNFGFGYDAYNHDGTHCADWPLPCGTIWSSTTMQITPVFGDVDNDGFLEIIGAATDIMGWVVECYLWDTDAAWNEDLAYMIVDGCNMQHNGLYAPATTPPVFAPPNNVSAEIQNFNEVLITWDPPGAATEYIQHHTGYDNNGIGTGTAVDFICAARFDDVELSNYYGNWEISRVNIFLHSMDFSYVGIQVYEGGSFGDPGTLVYEEEVTSSAVAGDWTNHLLTSPIPLVAGNEYWLAYDISATGDHPAAVDMGPMVPDKGAWMYFSGAWQTLPELGATLDYNWVITGALTESADSSGKNTAVIGRQHTISNSIQFEAEYTPSYRRPNSQVVNYNSRALAGYKIYRDGFGIAEITNPATLEYLDGNGLDAGDYEYYVTAVYEDPAGESEPSNIDDVTITLPAPENLTATSNWPNILLQWNAPSENRSIESYNVYRDGEFLANTTSTFYLDVNVPAGCYYNVACVFTGGYEGEWSNQVGPGPGTDPNLIPLATSLDGNYPNPFNPETRISFSTTESTENTEIGIYNLKGQKIKTLVSEILPIGYHSVIWNGTDESGKDVSSGVYIYKMKVGNFEAARKCLLLK